MICTTIQNKTIEQTLEALESCEMAEIRLDRCCFTMREIEECFASDVPLVATCRINELIAFEPSLQDETLSPQSKEIKAAQIAEKRLCKAIEAGARYVDVEIEAPKSMSKRVRNVAHENGTVFIRSFHDFEGTASDDELRAAMIKCHYHGADIVKLVTTARSADDVARVLDLYAWSRTLDGDLASLSNGGLIAFCMGEQGRQSRIDCLRLGAPYTYASLSEDEAAAPGQTAAQQMKKQIYGDFRFCTSASGPLKMPSSKSYAQRAIIAAALADGTSRLTGYTPCGDNESAVRIARTLGAEVEAEGDRLTIKGISASSGMLDTTALNVGESGLLARMMIPLMAVLGSGEVRIDGEKTLLSRPLTGAGEIMDSFGARIQSIGRGNGDDSISIPLSVCGPLAPGRTDIDGRHGSQLISGLLMALPFSEKNSTLTVNTPKSIPYMFITLEVLKKFGIRIGNEMLGGRDFLESDGDWSLCTEMVFKVRGGQRYKAADIDIEGDWSAAANFLVAGAVFGRTIVSGLDTTSLQADLSIMDILMDAGAGLSQENGSTGDVIAQRAPLKAFDVDASNCPDLFPIISVLAAFCQGTSHISGVGRLANKESDRASAIRKMLVRMGVDAVIREDELIIKGHTLAERLLNKEIGLLKGGTYSSRHDHRMLMALKVAELGADSPIIIDDEDCAAKSFPRFQEVFSKIR